MNWNQPVCTACWKFSQGDREPVVLVAWGRALERCANCGVSTTSGIYVRMDPRSLRYPKPDEGDPTPTDQGDLDRARQLAHGYFVDAICSGGTPEEIADRCVLLLEETANAIATRLGSKTAGEGGRGAAGGGQSDLSQFFESFQEEVATGVDSLPMLSLEDLAGMGITPETLAEAIRVAEQEEGEGPFTVIAEGVYDANNDKLSLHTTPQDKVRDWIEGDVGLERDYRRAEDEERG